MTSFLAGAPTLDANWRAVVLFGRNVTSYKFALAKALLGMADRADDRVPLEELAAPFARHLCEHLARVNKRTASRSSRFLDACRASSRGELAEDRLVEATARLGFNNVIDAFHVVGAGPVPARFFADERAGRGAPAGLLFVERVRRVDLIPPRIGSDPLDLAPDQWKAEQSSTLAASGSGSGFTLGGMTRPVRGSGKPQLIVLPTDPQTLGIALTPTRAQVS